MAILRVFDPAMCCSTGVCGPEVDPELVRFAADPVLRRRAGAERPLIEKVRAQLATRTAIVPLQAEEPAGREQLERLVRRGSERETVHA